VLERWSIDQIVGSLYSTSYASKNVLGNRAEDFELDIRLRLKELQDDGAFEKLVYYTSVIAQR
jgi:hypothetical protein